MPRTFTKGECKQYLTLTDDPWSNWYEIQALQDCQCPDPDAHLPVMPGRETKDQLRRKILRLEADLSKAQRSREAERESIEATAKQQAKEANELKLGILRSDLNKTQRELENAKAQLAQVQEQASKAQLEVARLQTLLNSMGRQTQAGEGRFSLLETD